jgi:hypothetical protein
VAADDDRDDADGGGWPVLFGLGLSMMTPVATLVLHIVFGLVLGGVYGLLGAKQASAVGYSR